MSCSASLNVELTQALLCWQRGWMASSKIWQPYQLICLEGLHIFLERINAFEHIHINVHWDAKSPALLQPEPRMMT